MSHMPQEADDLTEEQQALAQAYGLAAQLASACAQMRAFDTPAGHDPAGFVVNCLMTELWDQAFSQTEIRAAFSEALNDMNRYAAGEERRS